MKSLTQNLKSIQDALNSTSVKGSVHHYTKPVKYTVPYIVWQEDGESDSANVDNRKIEQQLHGTIDLYTKKEFDPLIDEIQEALNNYAAGWNLISVQYEDETKLIHYEWEFNIA